ncbi:MAG: hypothetical protein QM610_11895 [Chitinophagaceae bacterium]
MKFLDQIARYLYIKKKDPDEEVNTNTKLMHGMNRISIIVFLIAVCIVIIRLIFKH